MIKVCYKCKVEKDLSEFGKDKSKKYGLNSECKSCKREYYKANKEKINERNKEYHKEWYQTNKEKIKESNKEWYQTNKERINERNKEWREANKEHIKEWGKEYYEANKERRKEYHKEYRQANKERNKEYHKEYNQVNKERINERDKEYQRNRRKTDPLFKMKCNLRTRTWAAFKNKGYSKTSKTQEMLGVDWEVCKGHIERQFTKGMNWDNYGEWHIDHIIPLASANNEEELMKLCHYTNLQPLWAEDNLSKNDKIIEQQIKFRI
jgi:hypothetical protein